jgi:hypothetical protein
MRTHPILHALVLIFGCGSGDGASQDVAGPSNRAPVIQEQTDTTAAAGATLHLYAQASDADGDSLSYRSATIGNYSDFLLRGFPDSDMDAASGHFIFRVRVIDRPNQMFRFYANDGHGGVDSTQFTVIVN